MSSSLCRLARLTWIFSLLRFWAYATDPLFSDALFREHQLQTVLEHERVRETSCKEPSLTGPIETTYCDYESIDSVNEELFGNLSELVHMPFFRYFQVDLYRECPFWPENGSCNNAGCAITTVDESDIPERWRAKALSEVDPVSIEKRHSLPGCYYRDADFCFLDDHTEGDYFDLRLVSERYTGYSGKDAHNVWRAIYEENCFGISELTLVKAKSPAAVSLPDTTVEVLRNGEQEIDSQCLERRVYYKIISGLHASISIHVCREYLNQSTGEWFPNLRCFIDRIASHPERLQYMYFNTILMLRAVARLRPYLKAFDYCSTGTHEDDARTHHILSKVLNIASKFGRFDESLLFRGENSHALKEEFKTHFRNVSRIMDCVGCDKCRLWGKVQTTGVATALKVLFELDETALDPTSNINLLQRSEVVALMNTLYRFSESLVFVDDFRKMWRKLDEPTTREIVTESEEITAAQQRLLPETAGGDHTFLIDSPLEQVRKLVNAFQQAGRTILSAFRRLGKRQPQRKYQGEL